MENRSLVRVGNQTYAVDSDKAVYAPMHFRLPDGRLYKITAWLITEPKQITMVEPDTLENMWQNMYGLRPFNGEITHPLHYVIEWNGRRYLASPQIWRVARIPDEATVVKITWEETGVLVPFYRASRVEQITTLQELWNEIPVAELVS